MVMGMANLAMATGNVGRSGVGVNPLRGQNNVQGSCDMGSFPHELAGYRPIQDDEVRSSFRESLGAYPSTRIQDFAFRICSTPRLPAITKECMCRARTLRSRTRTPCTLRRRSATSNAWLCKTYSSTKRRNLRMSFSPERRSSKRTVRFINAERRINRVRPVMTPRTGMAEWEVTQNFAKALGYNMNYPSEAAIMDEIAALTPTFSGVSFEFLDRVGSVQWPCNEAAPMGTPIMHIDNFVPRQGTVYRNPTTYRRKNVQAASSR